MTTRTAPARHDNVSFQFLGTEEDSVLSGTVIVRHGEMVLEIRGTGGPYLIVGKAHKHWFEGANSASGRPKVDAKWAEVGGTYVGTWVEAGYDYLFSFDLGSAGA